MRCELRCEFCAKPVDMLYSGPGGIGLCEACHEQYVVKQRAYEEERSMNEKMIEMKAVGEEVLVENPVQETPEIKCEVRVGVTKEGGIYFNIGGVEPDLLTIDGLMEYGKRYMKGVWDQREKALKEVAAQDQE